MWDVVFYALTASTALGPEAGRGLERPRRLKGRKPHSLMFWVDWQRSTSICSPNVDLSLPKYGHFLSVFFPVHFPLWWAWMFSFLLRTTPQISETPSWRYFPGSESHNSFCSDPERTGGRRSLDPQWRRHVEPCQQCPPPCPSLGTSTCSLTHRTPRSTGARSPCSPARRWS